MLSNLVLCRKVFGATRGRMKAFRGYSTLFFTLILVFAFSFQHSAGQGKPATPLFPDQARVCFVGNSITQSGGYHHYLYLFHVTRFPKQRVTFFNCGVGGDIASRILTRAEEDIFVNKPDHLVLMVGMNDVNRPLYATGRSGDPATVEKKEQMLKVYQRDTEDLVRLFRRYTPDVVLIKPSIYDQSAQMATENLYGVNDALKVYGQHIGKLAKKYETKLVDFWTVLNDLNEQEQRKDPSFTIVGIDRIHPQATGHMVMAYQFLKTMNAPAYVAKMVIEKDAGRSNSSSINCQISNLKRNTDVVSFTCESGSLPFPSPSGTEQAFDLIPFSEELNKEILQVSGLRDGEYSLRIDDTLVGTYSSRDLAAGINLALCKNTPQYLQALQVMERCLDVKRLQGNLRLLKRVEYVDLEESERELGIDSIAAILNTRLQSTYRTDRYDFNRRLFSQYVEIKPRADEIRDSIGIAEDLVYKANIIVKRVYEIRRTN